VAAEVLVRVAHAEHAVLAAVHKVMHREQQYLEQVTLLELWLHRERHLVVSAAVLELDVVLVVAALVVWAAVAAECLVVPAALLQIKMRHPLWQTGQQVILMQD
jgi:hypothetical protein